MNVVFLDRDGTIIVEPDGERLIRKDEIKLFPETLPALELLAKHGFSVVIITNQAGISEGLISIEEYQDIHSEVLRQIQPSGIKILGTYMCQHSSKEQCACRKPKPKMLLDAASNYGLDLSNVYMIGDRISDVQAGHNAGTKTILVETAMHPVGQTDADYRAKNLLDAANIVIQDIAA